MPGTGLSTTLPGVSLLHPTVNFDHFQILRAIGKGSFGKVRKNLWVGQWRLGTCGTTEPHRLASSLLREASPITGAKSSGWSGKKQGTLGLSGVVSATLCHFPGRVSGLLTQLSIGVLV